MGALKIENLGMKVFGRPPLRGGGVLDLMVKASKLSVQGTNLVTEQ